MKSARFRWFRSGPARSNRGVKFRCAVRSAGWALLIPTLLWAQIPSGSDLDPESAEPLHPRVVRALRDEERLTAATMFAHGCLLAGRDDLAGALRQFQRAWRLDPAPPIAREIVAIAGSLKQESVGYRYAVASAERSPPDPELALKLAALLAEQGDAGRGLRILTKVAERDGDSPQGLQAVLCRAELARLALVTQQPSLAVRAGGVALQALETPERFGLEVGEREELARQSERLETVLAEAYFQTDRLDEAEKLFQQLEKRRPNEALRAWRAARLAWKRQDLATTRQQLDIYFQARGQVGGLEAYSLFRQLLAKEWNDAARAETACRERLEELLKADSRNVPLAFAVAERRVAAKDWPAAVALYENLLEREPTATSFRQLARIYAQQNQPDELLALLTQAVEQGDGWEIVRETLREVPERESAYRAMSARLREQAVDAAKPWRAEAYIGMALLGLEGNHEPDARQVVDLALQRLPAMATKIRETVALGAMVLEKPTLAVSLLREAMGDAPPEKRAAYWYYLAGALEMAGDTPGALSAAVECRSLRPENPLFAGRQAWVLYHAGQYQPAEAQYRELLERFDRKELGEETREQLRQARLVLSNLCVLSDKLPEAEEWLEQVLDEYPEHIGALNDLGYLWADQGKRLERALGMIQQAVAAEPENASYRDSLGWAYYRLGRFAEAVAELERAVREAPEGVIWDHLGDAYLLLPDEQRAVDAWTKGLELLKLPAESQQRDKIMAKLRKFTPPSQTSGKTPH